MPGNNALPSVLGNIVMQRQKLSAVRQRLMLEPSATSTGRMQPIAPSPPEGPAMDNKGAAVTAGAQPDIDPSMFDPAKNPITAHPQYDQMAQTVQQHFAANGLDDAQWPIQPMANDPAGAGAGTGSIVNDPQMLAALTPLTNFHRQNGRLPTLDELNQMQETRREMHGV